jgi:O-antigen/teichoic acid export membrane protein
VILVSLGFGLSGYIVAQVASALLVLGLLAGAAWKLTPPEARSFAHRLPSMEKEVVSFSGAALGLGFLQFLMSQTDRIMLGIYRDAREVGIYAVAGAMIVFVTVVLRSVNQIFAPIVSGLHTGQQREVLARMFQTLTKWILGLTVPLAGAMVFFASGLMGIFGRDFRAGWLVLVIGTLGELVNCGVGSSGTLLFMTGHQNTLVKIHAAAAVLMVALNLALTPRWGMTGAAISLAVTVGVTNIWYVIEVRRRLGLLPYNRSYFRLLVPVAGSLLGLWLCRARFGAMHPQWLVIGSAALLAYVLFVGLALAVGLDADDRMIARAVWSRVRSIIPRTEVGV